MKQYDLTKTQRDAIVERYASGEKRAVIAADFGVRDNYPRVLAARRGVAPRQQQKGNISCIETCVLHSFSVSSSSIGTATVIG